MEVTRSSSPSIQFEEMILVPLDFSKGHNLGVREKKKEDTDKSLKEGNRMELLRSLTSDLFLSLF